MSEIVNTRTGQRMRFVESSEGLLRIECWSAPSPVREPVHVHPVQRSRIEVLDGSLVVMVDGVERSLRASEAIDIPPNRPHRFWNESQREAHYVQEFDPAFNIRGFFEFLFRLANEGRLDERGMPSLLDIPLIVDEFSDVIRPTSPPWAVLRLTALLMGPLASARGHRRPGDVDVSSIGPSRDHPGH